MAKPVKLRSAQVHSEYDAEETIEEIHIRPMMEALDLLQDYDVNGNHMSIITPKLILKLRAMEPKTAANWLKKTFLSYPKKSESKMSTSKVLRG